MDNSETQRWPAPGAGHYVLLLLVFVAAALLYVRGLGSYPLWDPWEPKYAQSIAEMQQEGDLITPRLGGKIRWTKPILFYWAMALPLQLFENEELAVRLPSALSALLGVLLIYFFLRRLHGPRAGLIGACVLGTIPQYFFMARQAMPDMLLTLFLGGAMGFLALARFDREGRTRSFCLFYACVALAFLTKGPLACAVTLGALLIFWSIDFDPRSLTEPGRLWSEFKLMLGRYHVGKGALIFIAIAGPWYAVIWFIHGDLFIQSFIVGENIHRFLEPSLDHDGLVTYYLLTMIHGMFPWISLLPAALLFFFYGQTRVDESFRLCWYYLSWLIAIFLIFTTASTKLDHYILPITPVVAVIVALAFTRYLDADGTGWARPAILLAIPVALFPVKDYITLGAGHILDCFMPYQEVGVGSDQLLWVEQLVLAIWIVAILLAYLVRRSRTAVLLAILIALANGFYLTQHVLPLQSSERSLKHYTELVAEMREPDTDLVYFGWIRNSLTYYQGRDNFSYFQPEQVTELIQFVRDRPHVFIIAQDTYFEGLLDHLRRGTLTRWSTISSEHPRFFLISNHAPADGVLPAED